MFSLNEELILFWHINSRRSSTVNGNTVFPVLGDSCEVRYSTSSAVFVELSLPALNQKYKNGP